MDIYLSQHRYQPFLAGLEATCQVTYQPQERSNPKYDYTSVFILDVRRYSTPTGLCIDVIQSASMSPVTPLPKFWSSLLVNFLIPSAAVCGYPHHTLTHRGLLREAPISISSIRAWDKYKSRRFTFNIVEEWGIHTDEAEEFYFAPGDIMTVDFREPLQNGPLPLPIEKVPIQWVAKHPFPETTTSTHIPTELSSIYLPLTFAYFLLLPANDAHTFPDSS